MKRITALLFLFLFFKTSAKGEEKKPEVEEMYISQWHGEWYVTPVLRQDIAAHASEKELPHAQSNETMLKGVEAELSKHYDKESFVRHRIVVIFTSSNKPAYSLVVFRQTDASTSSMQRVYKLLKCVLFPDGTIVLPRKPTKDEASSIPDKGVHVPAFHVRPPEE